MWQLKNLQTGEALNEAQKLPENWGPIFGMAGIQDRLGNLSWLGDAYTNQGWVVVGDAPPDALQTSPAGLAWEKAKQLLRESDWAMLADVPMTVGEKDAWILYRALLRTIRGQDGFPNTIVWPSKPA